MTGPRHQLLFEAVQALSPPAQPLAIHIQLADFTSEIQPILFSSQVPDLAARWSTKDKVMAHGNVHIIKSRDEWQGKLAEADSNNTFVVVDFTASWCGPCKLMAPLFAELSEKFHNLIFLKVDVDELSDISTEFKVHAMPTFVFIEKKSEIDRLVGANKVELEKKVKLYSDKTAAMVA